MPLPENVNKPFITIIMATYNHEKYICQAIEGVLMQKTSFSYRLYIGEDCSTDNTKALCFAYAEKFMDKIEIICTEQNDYRQNCRNIWKASKVSGAKYIAVCDGDDYWTDPYKLQKQVDFLEAHLDFVGASHNVENWLYSLPNMAFDTKLNIYYADTTTIIQNNPF